MSLSSRQGLVTTLTTDANCCDEAVDVWRHVGLTGAAWDLVVAAPGPISLAHGARHLFRGQPEPFVTEIRSPCAC